MIPALISHTTDQASDPCRAAMLCEARVRAGGLGRVASLLGDIAEAHALDTLGLAHPGEGECGQRLQCGIEGQQAQALPQTLAR